MYGVHEKKRSYAFAEFNKNWTMRSTKRTTTPKDVTNANETTVGLSDGVEQLENTSKKDTTQPQETNLTAIPYLPYEKSKVNSAYVLQDKNFSNLDQYVDALRNSNQSMVGSLPLH